ALRACKIYVQPSRWEGKSIAIEEAKALQKPIICTRFGTVLEQIDDGRTGLVCKIAPASIAEAVQKLLEAPALRAQFIQNLKGLPGNETEAEKFLALWQ
ncbi:MAG: glycosyltransferase, partial [Oscillospiraceae bacterium]|nr:glycosyltransferase [Oscillospiraceae bacterium]